MLDLSTTGAFDALEIKHALTALLRRDLDQAADHLRRLAWPALIELAHASGYPTEGPLAWAIWRKSNLEPDPKTAILGMTRCGYVAFQGYPLVRLEQPVQITRSEFNCTDGSLFITYTFPTELPAAARPRAYELAMAVLKAEWPDPSRVYIGATGQGYSVRVPDKALPCTCNPAAKPPLN